MRSIGRRVCDDVRLNARGNALDFALKALKKSRVTGVTASENDISKEFRSQVHTYNFGQEKKYFWR